MTHVKSVSGLHVLGRVFLPENLAHKPSGWYVDQIKSIISAAGLNPVGIPGCHEFEGGGFTAFIMLAESHVSLHTWPELNFMDLDVFVCNVTRDNADRAREIFLKITALFEAVKITRREVPR